MLAEAAPMLAVSLLIFSGDHVGQARKARAEQRLAIKDQAEANLAHHFDFAGVEHLNLFDRLQFAVALISAHFEHARLFLERVGGLLELRQAGKCQHQPTIYSFVRRTGLGKVEVICARLLILLVRAQTTGGSGPGLH